MNIENICYGCFKEKGPGNICPYCGFNKTEEQPFLALPLGTVLNGRYMTGKVLGVGGFGITYLGYDLTLQIKVAIKEYMPTGLATRNSDQYNVSLTGRVQSDYNNGMEHFLDEARVLAKLQNTPNIVSVQNYFKENNTAYFVMEYIDGMSLKEYLAEQGGKIPYTQALAILLPVMDALVSVHSLNLMHRDISPDNIYITSKGESRLLDFGAARFATGDGKSVSVILKHGYAPEEQYSSHGNQGPWTDVYAMGATLYRCITGMLPPDSIERMHSDTIQKPSAMGIAVPHHIENALMKAMAVKTEDRFSNMAMFIQALNGSGSVKDHVANSITQKAKTVSFADGSEKPGGFVQKFKTNPMVRWITIGCAAIVVALCIILPITLSSGGKTTPPSQTTGAPLSTAAPGISTPAPSTSEPSASAPSAPVPSASSDVPSSGAADMVKQNLSLINASISVPSNYTPAENGLSFTNQTAGRAVETNYIWRLGLPIYSLDDVRSNTEAIMNAYVENMGIELTDVAIYTAGDDSVNGRNAYQIYFHGTNQHKVVMDFVLIAVEGNNDFGCYLLGGTYMQNDTEGQKEVYTSLYSFESAGSVDISDTMYASDALGLKFMYTDSLVGGGITEGKSEINENHLLQYAMVYPSNDHDSAAIEVENASVYASTADEAMSYFSKNMTSGGAAAGSLSTETYGGVTWQMQEFSLNSKNYCFAAADIDGQCYAACVTTASGDANEDTALTLFVQILSTLRPY